MRPFKQFNNITERVIDDLKESLTERSRLSVAAASFSIYAYEALKEELERVEELRFIFTSPTFNALASKKEKREFYIPKLGRERTLYGSEFEIKLRNQLTQRAIAKECADWIRRKATFKSNVTQGTINGFLSIHDGDETYTYQPFNEFTTTELGVERGNNMCTNILGIPQTTETDMFLRNFNNLWHDGERFKDVTEAVIENIETVYKENAPEFIYFITLYNIFNEFLEDISEDVLPNEATGFKSSAVWNKLYNFQRDAALAIINKLERYNGCILADSVGLGKTFTALAVIKYYESRNRAVLVLCPKKLNDNWQTFRTNYKNNPLLADRLRYDILFHSDLSRKGGYSNGIDLDRINWGNYDLIVIDESHNFRNGGMSHVDEQTGELKENRYAMLMNRVIRDGVKTKVLMLSATPVNNRFVDLQNQLQLAYEGDTANIDSELDTDRGINAIFAEANKAYARWTSTGDDNLLSANEKGDLEYRRKQLKALQEEVVDIEDMDTGINIMDLGLNEFRLDLLAYIKEHPNMDLTPFGMNAVTSSPNSDIQPGVIFVLKNKNKLLPSHYGEGRGGGTSLHPFYMVYLRDDGSVVCDHLSPKKLLDIMRHTCRGKSQPDRALCRAFNAETKDGRKMNHYSDLLRAAIDSIITVKQESDIDSLFSEGETTALRGEIKGLDDFELITFLVIK